MQPLAGENVGFARGAAAQNLPHHLRFQGPYAGQLAQSIISQRQVSPGFLTSWAHSMPYSLPGASEPPQVPPPGSHTPSKIADPTSPPVPKYGLSSTGSAFPDLEGAADPTTRREV